MRNVCAKMVPKNLMPEQKANRRDVCLDLLDRLERQPEFVSRVITGDESRIMECTTPRQNAKFGRGTLQTINVPRKRE